MALVPISTVIRDVRDSLRNLLANNIQGLTLGNIRYDSPVGYEPPADESVSLFFFQSKIDPYQRNEERSIVEEGLPGNVVKYRDPPIAIELIFMITPFGTDTGKDAELYEAIMAIFYDNPVLEGSMLAGTLIDQGNERIQIIPTEYDTQVINNLWSVAPNKPYKPSLFYTLSPVYIQSGKVSQEKLIQEKEVTYKEM